MVPLSYLVNVGTDGRGLGEEVTVPAGKHSDVVVNVPAGSTVAWRWGAQAHDAIFSVVSAPAAAAPAAVPSGTTAPEVLRPTKSICGVHQLAKGYTGPVPHGLRQAYVAPVVYSAGATIDALPHAVPGAAPVTVQAPVKVSSHSGSYAVPASLPGGATHAVVLLRWDNGYAWMTSKTLARRVDVALPGDSLAEASTELESDEAEIRAREREANMAAFPSEAMLKGHAHTAS